MLLIVTSHENTCFSVVVMVVYWGLCTPAGCGWARLPAPRMRHLCCLEVTPPSDYFPSSVTITNTPLAWGGFSYTEASSPTQSLTWMPGAIVLLTLV